MRYIFIDSNIYYNNWHLTSADFKLLSSFIKNSSTTLLLSEIVSDEVQNLYKRNEDKAIEDLKKSISKSERFLKEKVIIDFNSLLIPYSFRQTIKDEIEFIEFIDFSDVPNRTVVDRAINKKLPFRENEKGYRDTLIWLSLLKHLSAKTKKDEVIFISQNLNDFYNNDKSNFHADLLEDLAIENIQCEIKPFLTLNAFIKELKIEDEEFNHEKINEDYLHKIEQQIASVIQEYISNLSTSEFKRVIEESNRSYFFLSSLIDHDFYMDEGIEDPVVINYRKVSSSSLYITYSLNLRRCGIDFVIPEFEYLKEPQRFERFKPESYQAEDEFHIVEFCRPDLVVNFIYDIESETVSGLELESLNFI